MIDTNRAFPDATLGVTPKAMNDAAVMKEFDLSFAPNPGDGHGRGKVYHYDDAQFAELYAAASKVTGDARKRICDLYGVGWPTLQKRVGAGTAAKKRQSRSDAKPAQQGSIIDRIEALASDVDSAIRQLDEERADLEQRIEEIDRKKAFLQKVAALTE